MTPYQTMRLLDNSSAALTDDDLLAGTVRIGDAPCPNPDCRNGTVPSSNATIDLTGAPSGVYVRARETCGDCGGIGGLTNSCRCTVCAGNRRDDEALTEHDMRCECSPASLAVHVSGMLRGIRTGMELRFGEIIAMQRELEDLGLVTAQEEFRSILLMLGRTLDDINVRLGALASRYGNTTPTTGGERKS